MLVKSGADANLANVLDMLALDLATAAGHHAVETYLSDRSDNTLSMVRKARLGLFGATKADDYNRVKYLIEIDKVNVDMKEDDDGATPLMFAAMRG